MFCEQCGAKLEADARFCVMCGRQVEKDGAASAAGGLSKSISDLRIGVFKKGVVPALLMVLVLGVALLLMFRPDEIDLSDIVNGKSQLSRGTAKDLIAMVACEYRSRY